MSTMTLQNQAVRTKKSLWERLENYFRDNMETVALGAVGMYTQPAAGGVSGEAGYFFIMGVGNCALCVCPGRTGFLLYTVFENVYNICCVSSKRVYLIRINLYMPKQVWAKMC